MKVLGENENVHGECKLCRGNLARMYYYCSLCDFSIDLICARKQVITIIEGPKTHKHPLLFVPKMIMFTCHLCGLPDDRFPYACNLCGLSFHKDCAESTPEINYPCHTKHLLKRFTHVPSYTDGKCCFCGKKLQNLFYHCSLCNFSIDVDCEKNPPEFTLIEPKAHEHSLILMPQRSFVCSVCGMDDDPNPYVCPQCNFMIHRNCVDVPRIIKIYRHDHRIIYNYCLDAGDWNCGVCHKKINWICGAYSCTKCPKFVIHFRCATRFGIWDGIKLDGIPENTLEFKSYEEIEEGVIKHFSHENHTLNLQEVSDSKDEYLECEACTYPILSNSFYRCMKCVDFIIHKECAYLPKKKINSFYKTMTTLKPSNYKMFICTTCQYMRQGFRYVVDDFSSMQFDVQCGSISEPYFHESHPLHSLYINYSTKEKYCNACGDKATTCLSCEECVYVLHIKCSVSPKMVKHNYDKDHILSLCYGGKTSEQYWCDICEKNLNPKKWFYSCDVCGTTFHVICTLGDFTGFKQERKTKQSSVFSVMLNNCINRPVCEICNFRCQFPYILKVFSHIFCSQQCFQNDVRKFQN